MRRQRRGPATRLALPRTSSPTSSAMRSPQPYNSSMMQRSRSSMRARSSGCGSACLPGRSAGVAGQLYRFIHPQCLRVWCTRRPQAQAVAHTPERPSQINPRQPDRISAIPRALRPHCASGQPSDGCGCACTSASATPACAAWACNFEGRR
jgi:hypothetical protein